ncbi:MAG: transporter substrate-binding domain-containing protein [Desulfobulbus sp.]|jgi:signal transduction histidine kinase/ABC-type amino acid transport substrate-binding protein|uniref:ATP-binding protein n=1 Tax=Desulfobulbus sp. TaxID=895 RepID=UPI00284D4251|nr:transporter substrate-binding domain-containing protein [Desulfobulbus sp.]MDR2549527.1 transporter substrate-binding domain-containing protein [Desulfobulbus sp.]
MPPRIVNQSPWRRNLWLARLILLLLLMLHGACTTHATEQEHLVVAGLIQAYPYSYLDEYGEPAGIHVELAQAVAEAAGVQVEIQLMAWDEALQALESGRADVLLSALYGESKSWELLFSDAHSTMDISFFSKKQANLAYENMTSSHHGMRHGIYAFISDYESLNYIPTSSQLKILKINELFNNLEEDKIDIAICPREIGLEYIKNNKLTDINLNNYPIINRKVCFAAKKKNQLAIDKLNSGLRKIQNTKKYYDIIKTKSKPIESEHGHGFSVGNFLFPLLFTIFLVTGSIFIEKKRKIFGRGPGAILLTICFFTQIAFIISTYYNARNATIEKTSEQIHTMANLNAMLLVNRIDRAKEGVKSILADPLFINTIASLKENETSPFATDDQIGGQAIYAMRLRLVELTRGWRRSEASLLDSAGLVLLSSNPTQDGSELGGFAAPSENSGAQEGRVHVDIYRPDAMKEAFIQLYMPLDMGRHDSPEEKSRNFVVLRIPLNEFLVPLQWELQSMGGSGEILLFQNNREKQRYECMNDARLIPDALSALQYPYTPLFGLSALIQKTFLGKTGVSLTEDYRGTEVVCAYQPISFNQNEILWAMLVKRDKQEILFQEKQSLRNSIIQIFSFALAVSLVGVLVARSMNRRIQKLDEVVAKITKGNIELEPTIEKNDDLARLARSLMELNAYWKKRFSFASHLSGMGQFAAGMAHEVRTPLTSIKVILQSLEMQLSLDDDQKEDFIIMQKEIKRLNDLVTKFLILSKPPELHIGILDLNALMQSIVKLISSKADQNIHIIFISFREAIWITGDESQLSQVFLNICTNALEAMENGGVLKIEVIDYTSACAEFYPDRSEFEQDQFIFQGFCEVAISDTGCGIPEENKLEIFKPFFTNKRGGTGLGLAIASNITERHGGLITVENNQNGGCTFKIMLPSQNRTKHEKNINS